MGRLWQTTLLAKFHPVFEFTTLESIIRSRQEDYYKALGLSDKAADAGPFIEFSLETISQALEDLSSAIRPEPISASDRLAIAREQFRDRHFSRKEYLAIFKILSTATASRDLAHGVQNKILKMTGEKARTSYCFK